VENEENNRINRIGSKEEDNEFNSCREIKNFSFKPFNLSSNENNYNDDLNNTIDKKEKIISFSKLKKNYDTLLLDVNLNEVSEDKILNEINSLQLHEENENNRFIVRINNGKI